MKSLKSEIKTETNLQKSGAIKKRTQTNKNSLKNLKPFKKGKSGNVSGGPKGERLSTQIRRALSEIAAKGKGGKEYTHGEIILKALLKKAGNGDARSIELLYDRLEGKPKSGLLNIDEEDNDNAIGAITVTIERE